MFRFLGKPDLLSSLGDSIDRRSTPLWLPVIDLGVHLRCDV